MGRKKKLKKGVRKSAKGKGATTKDESIAEQHSAERSANREKASLDMTITYDYTCHKSSRDQTKSMEELSDLFSFTGAVCPPAHCSTLWTNVNSNAPPAKKSKPDDSDLQDLHSLVATVGSASCYLISTTTPSSHVSTACSQNSTGVPSSHVSTTYSQYSTGEPNSHLSITKNCNTVCHTSKCEGSQTSTIARPRDCDHCSMYQHVSKSSTAQREEDEGDSVSSDEEGFWTHAAEVLTQQELADNTPLNSWDVDEEQEASILFQELLSEEPSSF